MINRNYVGHCTNKFHLSGHLSQPESRATEQILTSIHFGTSLTEKGSSRSTASAGSRNVSDSPVNLTLYYFPRTLESLQNPPK